MFIQFCSRNNTKMALRRILGLNYSIILNPRLFFSKFQPSPLIHENLLPRLSVVAPSFSTKPCYDEVNVTFPCLKQLLDESDIQLFDVRTRREVEAGIIPGAINIPLDEIEGAFSLSPEDFKAKYNVPKPGLEDENITFHCRTGQRAQEAIQMLQAMGFSKTHNYTGGWVEWQQAMAEDMAAAMIVAADTATATSN